MRVVSAAEGGPAPYYRVSQLTYDSVEDLQAGGSRPKTAGPPPAVARTSHSRQAGEPSPKIASLSSAVTSCNAGRQVPGAAGR